ncbi:hypothetical protein ABT173_27620 [Streptomyces sp. NPDC001795]|uniref:hypothetical protein n=1 Tax=unclassified Streptomyces TaxID=2593676 RepID=UPI0033296084
MSADDLCLEDQWPLLPAWIWDCAVCVRMYEAMRHIQGVMAELRLGTEQGVDWDFMDTVPGTQIRLGEHLAAEHAERLPGWDDTCETCSLHRYGLARDSATSFRPGAAKLAAEHRARHVFAPPRIVGLM